MKKWIVRALMGLLLACLVLSGVQVVRLLLSYRAGTMAYEELNRYISLEPEEPSRTRPEVPEGTEEPDGGLAEGAGEEQGGSAAGESWPVVDFDALSAINPDVVAWLYAPDTAISYPVVLGSDNEFYLHHLFNGQANSAGTLFLDYRNSAGFSDFNNIIYGHHMKNGSMFAGLSKYQQQDYFDAHPTMQLLTPEGNYEVQIFAGRVFSVEEEAWQLDFGTREDREEWLQGLLETSCFQSGVVPGPEDTILTLSTCSYEFENARFVLFARLAAAD